MPLSMARSGQSNVIMRITGKAQVRRHLNDLGFVEGATVTVVSELAGNLILSVKDTRIALDRAMAGRIIV